MVLAAKVPNITGLFPFRKTETFLKTHFNHVQIKSILSLENIPYYLLN